jgi:hypothetical protein
MEVFDKALLWTALGLVALLSMRWYSGALLVINVRLASTILGIWLLETAHSQGHQATMLFMGGALATTFGFWAASRLTPQATRQHSRSHSTKAFPESTLYLLVCIVGLLGLYHVFAAGIPYFSPNVERARFDFRSSGLWGIPSRMFLFGSQITVVITGLNAVAKQRRWREYGPFRMALSVTIVLALLSGFKGSLLNIAVLLIILQASGGVGLYRVADIIKRFWAAIALIFLYIVAVASTYSTYSLRYASTIDALLARVTTEGARPAWNILTGSFNWTGGNAFLHDVEYLVQHYATSNTFQPAYPFVRAVSSHILGIDPVSTLWAPPVTVTGFAEIYAGHGYFVALASMLAVGATAGFLERYRFANARLRTVATVLTLMLVDFVAKGNSAYVTVNWLASLLFIWAILTVLNLGPLLRSEAPRSYAGRRARLRP